MEAKKVLDKAIKMLDDIYEVKYLVLRPSKGGGADFTEKKKRVNAKSEKEAMEIIKNENSNNESLSAKKVK